MHGGIVDLQRHADHKTPIMADLALYLQDFNSSSLHYIFYVSFTDATHNLIVTPFRFDPYI